MSYTHLIVEVGQRFVATLTLNRPEQLNTFNSLLAEELTRTLMASSWMGVIDCLL